MRKRKSLSLSGFSTYTSYTFTFSSFGKSLEPTKLLNKSLYPCTPVLAKSISLLCFNAGNNSLSVLVSVSDIFFASALTDIIKIK